MVEQRQFVVLPMKQRPSWRLWMPTFQIPRSWRSCKQQRRSMWGPWELQPTEMVSTGQLVIYRRSIEILLDTWWDSESLPNTAAICPSSSRMFHSISSGSCPQVKLLHKARWVVDLLRWQRTDTQSPMWWLKIVCGSISPHMLPAPSQGTVCKYYLLLSILVLPNSRITCARPFWTCNKFASPIPLCRICCPRGCTESSVLSKRQLKSGTFLPNFFQVLLWFARSNWKMSDSWKLPHKLLKFHLPSGVEHTGPNWISIAFAVIWYLDWFLTLPNLQFSYCNKMLLLTDLPLDILHLLLRFLDAKSLCKLGRTCKSLHLCHTRWSSMEIAVGIPVFISSVWLNSEMSDEYE